MKKYKLVPVCLFLAFLFTGCLRPPISDTVGIELISPPNNSFEDLVWSPDSTRIAATINAVVNSWTSKIMIIDVMSRKTTLVFETGNGNLHTQTWSPDGNKIVFSSELGGDWQEGLWTVDISTSEEPQFLEVGYNAAWEPNGERIALLSQSSTGNSRIQEVKLYDVNTGLNEVFFSDGDKYSTAGNLSWSPEGSKLAFYFGKKDYGNALVFDRIDIYILDLVTRQILRLTNDGINYSPSWSSNGRMIAYIHESENGESEILISNADGSCKVTIPEITSVRQISWSPDGRMLGINIQGFIYLLDVASVMGDGFLDSGPICP